jgi:hypothetical protein
MLSSLVLCLTLSGRLGADLPQPQHHRLQAVPWRNIEEFHRHHLELTRNRRAGLEEMVKWWEKMLKDPLFTPKEVEHHRQHVVYLLECVQQMKKYEQVLEWYEQQRRLNPGPETEQEALDRITKVLKEQKAWQDAWDQGKVAPLPREVKK